MGKESLIMENFMSGLSDTGADRNEFIDKLINYESKMMKLFKEFELKPAHQQLIRAFIIACNGETEFEMSFTELDGLMTKKGNGARKSAYALQSLQKWQDENKIELVRVVKRGQRKRKDDGSFEYIKTKYRFIFLEDIVDVFYSDGANFEDALDELIAILRDEYTESKRTRKYHPRHNLKKAKRTIETKFRKVFDLALEAGLNPVQECRMVVESIRNILRELEAAGRENKAKFIMNFETLLVDKI